MTSKNSGGRSLRGQKQFLLNNSILPRAGATPRERAVRAIDRFFETEAEEAELRRALQDAAVLYRHSREFQAHTSRVAERVRHFMSEVWPARRVRGQTLDFASRFVVAVVSATAEEVTNQAVDRAELRRWSRACSAMLCDHFGL